MDRSEPRTPSPSKQHLEIRARTSELLLGLLHPCRETAGTVLSGALAAPQNSIDWEWLQERACTHKVGPLLASRLQEGVGRRSLPTVGGARDTAKTRGRRAVKTLECLAQALGARGIPFLVIKGSILAEWVYGDPGLRSFYDVDLVVAQKDIEAAERALGVCGYEFVAPTRLFTSLGIPKPADAVQAEAFARGFAFRHHFQHVYRPTGESPGLHVDLHWRLLPPAFGAADHRDIWERPVSVDISGVTTRTLDPETMLLYQALHAMRDRPGVFRLQPLVDLAWLLQRRGQGLDWVLLEQRAHAWRARHHLRRALEAVAAFFPGVIDYLPSRALDRRGRAFAWLLDPLRVVESRPGEKAAASGGGRLARGRDTLLWRFGTGDLCRVLRMKAAERATALRYRFADRLPNAPALSPADGGIH